MARNEVQNPAINDVRPKLQAVYSELPKADVILEAVHRGEQEFLSDLRNHGLDVFGADTSLVHAYSDVEVQAFILSVPSQGNRQEMVDKAYLTYGAHWLDDFFDGPLKESEFKQRLKRRSNIRSALEGMGPVGEAGELMASKSKNPAGVYRGLHRMYYGGLVQHSASPEQRGELLKEFTEVSTQGLDPKLVSEIETLQPEAYWSTNKSVQELINAAEEQLDYNVAEVWNLIYAPALYYHDIIEEEARGESSFTEGEKPRLGEMVRIIQIGSKYLQAFPDEKQPMRIEQLKFLLQSFKQVLPSEIVAEYERIIESIKA